MQGKYNMGKKISKRVGDILRDHTNEIDLAETIAKLQTELDFSGDENKRLTGQLLLAENQLKNAQKEIKRLQIRSY